MKKPTIQELSKKYLNGYEPTFDGIEFDGNKIIGKNTLKIKPKNARLFIEEVNKYYPLDVELNKRVISELNKTNSDITFYLDRYFLGNGFKYYSD